MEEAEAERGKDHPERHGDHHQILRQRDEAQRNVAAAADARDGH